MTSRRNMLVTVASSHRIAAPLQQVVSHIDVTIEINRLGQNRLYYTNELDRSHIINTQ